MEMRLREDPYVDPFSRDPWVRERPVAMAPEPEPRLFVPTESIDYGHGPAAKPAVDEAVVIGLYLLYLLCRFFSASLSLFNFCHFLSDSLSLSVFLSLCRCLFISLSVSDLSSFIFITLSASFSLPL